MILKVLYQRCHITTSRDSTCTTFSTSFFYLLPPANEVWGKVIFLHLFVILFTGGCLVPGWWRIPPGSYCCGGTHPTGMHSYWPLFPFPFSLNAFTDLTETYLNFGTGEAGGGSHCNPLASSLVKALATALAAGVGTDGVGGTCCVLLCLTGEPTQSFTRRPNSSANALPSLDDADNSGLMCFI